MILEINDVLTVFLHYHFVNRLKAQRQRSSSTNIIRILARRSHSERYKDCRVQRRTKHQRRSTTPLPQNTGKN